MRSVALIAGLALLAACERTEPAGPAEATSDAVATAAATPPAATETVATSTPEPTPPASPRAPAKPFQALGTEPFWSVEVLPGQLRYSHPENIPGTTIAADETVEGKGVRFSGVLDGKPFSLLVEPGTCSDGMSDTVYAWKAALTVDGRTEQGCARKR